MENDIIKLGRRKYEVMKINVIQESNYNEEDKDSIYYKNKKYGSVFDISLDKDNYCPNVEETSDSSLNKTNNKNNDKIKCRECSSSDSEENNPIIKFCKCNDKYRHYNCLKEFLKQKIYILENEKKTVTSYLCDKFNCEIYVKGHILLDSRLNVNLIILLMV